MAAGKVKETKATTAKATTAKATTTKAAPTKAAAAKPVAVKATSAKAKPVKAETPVMAPVVAAPLSRTIKAEKADKANKAEKAEKRAEKKGMFKRAVEQAASLGKTQLKEGEGFVQHLYPDYETYRKVQEEGNKAKLKAQFVKKTHIFFLAEWMKEQRAGGGKIDFGLCHGVRRGKEQMWFRKRLDRAEVIGTDISETATEFENTVQWDFHDENPAWEGRADFVYSNSWDHAYDPHKAFRAWMKSLKPGGWLLIDHTSGQTPKTANALDPFGATLEATIRILNEAGEGLGKVVADLDRMSDPDYAAHVIVFRRD
ncbi:MAG: methyltransferase domain-containing protein [Pseudorhodobacter sp.]|nr:MAG: methyltransferase domain-containing protein [Pseudorhodobacter sp.]